MGSRRQVGASGAFRVRREETLASGILRRMFADTRRARVGGIGPAAEWLRSLYPAAMVRWKPRLATACDADEVAQLLHDFNTEFGSPSPGVEVLAARLRVLLATDETVAILAGTPAVAVALVTLRPNVWSAGRVALARRAVRRASCGRRIVVMFGRSGRPVRSQRRPMLRPAWWGPPCGRRLCRQPRVHPNQRVRRVVRRATRGHLRKGGRKKRSGSMSTSSSWAPVGAAHQRRGNRCS